MDDRLHFVLVVLVVIIFSSSSSLSSLLSSSSSSSSSSLSSSSVLASIRPSLVSPSKCATTYNQSLRVSPSISFVAEALRAKGNIPDGFASDLLVGVFPLVFAIDAILPSTSQNSPGPTLLKDKDREASSVYSREEGAQPDSNSKEVDTNKQNHLSLRRLINCFLNAVACSLVGDEQPPCSHPITINREKTRTTLQMQMMTSKMMTSSWIAGKVAFAEPCPCLAFVSSEI